MHSVMRLVVLLRVIWPVHLRVTLPMRLLALQWTVLPIRAVQLVLALVTVLPMMGMTTPKQTKL